MTRTSFGAVLAVVAGLSVSLTSTQAIAETATVLPVTYAEILNATETASAAPQPGLAYVVASAVGAMARFTARPLPTLFIAYTKGAVDTPDGIDG